MYKTDQPKTINLNDRFLCPFQFFFLSLTKANFLEVLLKFKNQTD